MSVVRSISLHPFLSEHKDLTIINLIKKQSDTTVLLINETNEEGLTPLALAARDGKTQLVRWLLSANAEVEQKESKGEVTFSPLYLAIKNQHIALAELLLAYGADRQKAIDIATQQNKPELIVSLNKLKVTPDKICADMYWAITHFHSRGFHAIHRLQKNLLQSGSETLASEWTADVKIWIQFARSLEQPAIEKSFNDLLSGSQPEEKETKSGCEEVDILKNKLWFLLYSQLKKQKPENYLKEILLSENHALVQFILRATDICIIDFMNSLSDIEVLQTYFIERHVHVPSVLHTLISRNLQWQMNPKDKRVFNMLFDEDAGIEALVKTCAEEQHLDNPILNKQFNKQFRIMTGGKQIRHLPILITKALPLPGNIGEDIWKQILGRGFFTSEELEVGHKNKGGIKTVCKAFAQLLIPEGDFINLQLQQTKIQLAMLFECQARLLEEYNRLGCFRYRNRNADGFFWLSTIGFIVCVGLTVLGGKVGPDWLDSLINQAIDNLKTIRTRGDETCYQRYYRPQEGNCHLRFFEWNYDYPQCQSNCDDILNYHLEKFGMLLGTIVIGCIGGLCLLAYFGYFFEMLCCNPQKEALKPAEDFSLELKEKIDWLQARGLMSSATLNVRETKAEIETALSTKTELRKRYERKLKIFKPQLPESSNITEINHTIDVKSAAADLRTPLLTLHLQRVTPSMPSSPPPRVSCCARIMDWFSRCKK